MANILLTASRWTDESNASPPAYWNGSTYEFFDQYDSGIAPAISAVANAGDEVSFSLDIKVPGASGFTNTAQLKVNGVAVWTQDVSAVGTFSFTSAALAAGDAVEFTLFSDYGPIYKIDAVLTPTPDPAATDETLVVASNTTNNPVTTGVTQQGSPVTPDSLAIATQPLHGSAAVQAGAIIYTPAAGYVGADSFTYTGTVAGTVSTPGTVTIDVQTNFNCDCDDDHPTETLADIRTYLMVRLGFAAMLASPPPGMTELLNSFAIEAQNLLYHRFRMLRLERWFTWQLQQGVRFYDLAASLYACTKKLDPSRVRWVGISLGDSVWRPLACGIEPTRYMANLVGIPDSYEIRQCIEVFPPPSDSTWRLRIKGDFGLLPFAADTDVTTIDPQAIKLHALAYAKAHYQQPDAANHMTALTTFLGDLTASTHLTKRYIPGETVAQPAIRPKVVT
ncbi:Ig-like domain-containing protein [Dyella sp. KRB-257]|uniref:Ig-like domain-containing protein n=1 Tax=Dyella sp. KRB-257 TaxID=3400915 RepID=UPI003C0D6D9A